MELQVLTAILLVALIAQFFWLLSLHDKVADLQKQVFSPRPYNIPQPTPTTQPVVRPAAVPQSMTKPVPAHRPEPAAPLNWIKIFSWVGGFLLLLGIAFWIKYTLEKNLISPSMRISGALVFGAVLWWLGARMKNPRAKLTADTLCAVGLSVAYIALFSAHAFYHLIGRVPSFALLGLTTLAAFATAVWKKAPYVGILAQIIGFLTPFLFPSAQPNWFFFLLFVLCIAAAGAAASIWCKWPKQLIAGIVMCSLCFFWAADTIPGTRIHLVFSFLIAFGTLYAATAYFSKNASVWLTAAVAGVLVQLAALPPSPTVVACVWFGVLFVLFALPVFLLQPHVEDETHLWWALVVTAVMNGCVMYGMGKELFPLFKELIPACFTLLFSEALYQVFLWKKRPEKQPLRLAVLGGLAVFFLTYTFIGLFKCQMLTLVLAVEGAFLIGLQRHLPTLPKMKELGKFLLCTVAIRLLFNPCVLSYYEYIPKVFNWILYTYGLCGLAMWIAARLWQPRTDKNTIALLQGFGAAVWFALLNLEIAVCFSEGPHISLDFTSPMAAAATYTIVWALCGAACLFAASPKAAPWLHKTGLVLVGAALLKLFLCDIWGFSTGTRVVVLVSVAVIMMTVSFVYQRFKTTLATPPEKTE